jgi:carbamoyl-phosphate synthase large subunit
LGFNILVTGVGAIIGQGIVEALRASEVADCVIGLDRSPHTVGTQLCDRFISKPPFAEDTVEYLDFWRELLVSQRIDLVLPGIESDVLFLDRHRDALGQLSALAINTSRMMSGCCNKLTTYFELSSLDVARIPTLLASATTDLACLGPGPYVLKPCMGNGSRGIHIVETHTDYLQAVSGCGETPYIVQPYLGDPDHEYTASAFGLGNGHSLSPIVFRRLLSTAGYTSYVEVQPCPDIASAIETLSWHFQPVGPTNYQFRLHEGRFYLLEINPRFSSSTSLKAAFGYNEAKMCIQYFLQRETPSAPEILNGRAWRKISDVIVYESAHQ